MKKLIFAILILASTFAWADNPNTPLCFIAPNGVNYCFYLNSVQRFRADAPLLSDGWFSNIANPDTEIYRSTSSKTLNFATQETAPTAPTAALAGAGAGNVDNGAHIAKIYFVATGTTEIGTASSTVTVVDKTTNGKIALTAIPTGTSGVVTDRGVCLTQAGGSTYYLVGLVGDNTTTTYTINSSDTTIASNGLCPTNNTSMSPRLVMTQSTLLFDGAALTPGAAALVIGTTPITSGTSTRVLFDDAAVLGEDIGLTYTKATQLLSLNAGTILLNGSGGTGTFAAAAVSPTFKSNAADIADAGVVRLANAELIAWEKAITGTDWTLGVNSSDILATNAPFSSSVSVSAPFFVSSVATGTAPWQTTSITLNTNLNADLLDGFNTATAATASTVAVRDSGGGLTGDTVNANSYLFSTGSVYAGGALGASTFLVDTNGNVHVATQTGTVGFGGYGFANANNAISNADDLMLRRNAPGALQIDNTASSPTASSVIASGTKALTDNADVVYAKVTMTSGSETGGIINYTCEDTTTKGAITGSLKYAAQDTTGTITCAISGATPGLDASQAIIGGSAGFACAAATSVFTCADATGNILNLLAQAITTGGTDVLRLKYTIIANDSKLIVAQ